MKKAILSVFNKNGILDFARELNSLNYKILSTSGTFQLLEEGGVLVQKIEDYIGVPELLEGKVKTLHPKLYAGILRSQDEENAIQLVAVNLYPFKEKGIDIGGCALLRAAAKNYENAIVVCDSKDYQEVIDRLKSSRLDREFRKALAAKAFRLTAAYDMEIANSLSEEMFPDRLLLSYQRSKKLAYGENPFQQAALYVKTEKKETSAATACQLQGKPLTFNNILDADSAISIVKKFEGPACAIVKHNNPCGVAEKENSFESFIHAYEADSLCAFGGVVAFNCSVDLETAQALSEQFLELVIAPDYEEEALRILGAKKILRILKVGNLSKNSQGPILKEVDGGLLYQSSPTVSFEEIDYRVVTEKQPTPEEMRDLLFAAKVNQEVKSNSIVIAKDRTTLGIGAGQMSRVDSTFLALYKAKGKSCGAVLSSDGFFPFSDSIEMANDSKIAAIIQPGGSKKDQEVIDACNQFGIAMVFTGKRLFKH